MFNKKVGIIIICAVIGLIALNSISLDKVRNVITNGISNAIDKEMNTLIGK